MLLHNTLEHLHALRLRGMAAALEEQLTSSAVTDLSFEDRIGFLVEREVTWRDDRRLQRLLQDAKLREDASVEDINFRAARGLDRSVLMRLATCEWIRQHQVVLIVGPTGCVFRSFRPSVPVHSGHRFRRKPATDSDPLRPPSERSDAGRR